MLQVARAAGSRADLSRCTRLSVGPALESEVKVEGMSSGTEEQPKYALAEKVSAAHVLTRGSGIAL